ncbi:MAG: DNA recombination protein RmuC [Rhodospirillaceae bacterium]|nr:DNA recombination protein RmuC [Rhodospirillaceae bacterium]
MGVGETVLAVAGVAIAVMALVLALRATRQNQGGDRLAQVAETQSLLTGRLSQMAEGQTAAQARMAEQLQAQERAVTKLLDERLAEVTRRIGETLQRTSDKNTETMGVLQERLAVIDAAQKNITDLSAEFMSLQDILSNKQVRGAIGQTQMEDLVRNMLPPGAYDFQVTLSNGKRADCVIRLPNPPGVIAVDSKYPHEAFMQLMAATDSSARAAAEQAFRTDVIKHIRDIADKYIIPGETADSAIMFVPAESVFAELHDRFPGIVEEGFRRRVYIVSPTTLMATLNTVRAILKDARMREQAHIIQTEIGKLMEDVVRLDKRVGQLATHFDQTQKDVSEIRTSTTKIIKRGVAIENIQLEAPVIEPPPEPPLAGLLTEDEPQPPRLQ